VSVVNVWHGAMTPTGFRVVAKVTGAGAVLVVGTAADLAAPVFRSDTHQAALSVVDITASGLQPDTEYHYGLEVDGVLDSAAVGRTRTFPKAGAPASFRFIASACAGAPNGGLTGGTDFWPSGTLSRVSNSSVFSTIASRDPLLFIHLGDMHYRDIPVNDPRLYRKAFDDVLSAPRQAALYRDTPLAYMWDDHDYATNDSSKAAPGRPAAIQVYRERVPAYPLNHAEGVWQTFVVGRVRFVMTDLRSMADPYTDPESPTKSLTGAEQEAWLLDILGSATEELLVWVSTIGYGRDLGPNAWEGYPTQRNRLASWFQDHPDVVRRLVVVSGDWHGTGFDDGRNNRWGGFPIFQCGPLDSFVSANASPVFSHGTSLARGQYGVFEVEDTGSDIALRATAYRDDAPLFQYGFTVQRPVPPLVQADSVQAGVDGAVAVHVNYRGTHYDDVTVRIST
jgi:phosphodiesterase/alkaline phosphatase D-like protein